MLSSLPSSSIDSTIDKTRVPFHEESRDQRHVSSVMGGEVMPKYNDVYDPLVVEPVPNVLA